MNEAYPEPFQAPSHSDPSTGKNLRAACALVLAGIALIGAAAFVDARVLAGEPWARALIHVEQPEDDDEGGNGPSEAGSEDAGVERTGADIEYPEPSWPVKICHVPAGNYPPSPIKGFLGSGAADKGGGHASNDAESPSELAPLIQSIEQAEREWLVVADLPREELASLLASGRLPHQGANEVLAGPYTRLETFSIGEQSYQVTGQLSGKAGIFSRRYVLPANPSATAFEGLPGSVEVKRGTLVRDGEQLAEHVRGEAGQIGARGMQWLAGHVRAPVASILLCIAGLALAAAGGTLGALLLSRMGAERNLGPLNPAFKTVREFPALALAVHVLLYGLFLFAMASSLSAPGFHLVMQAMVRGEFASGALEHVGAAYDTGNILYAALHTWLYNYGNATLVWSYLPSLFIPGGAMIKNVLTFGVVGWIMAPQWAGTAGGYLWHSITMITELDAYILMSFASLMVPWKVFDGFRNGRPAHGYLQGVRILTSTALLAGLILAFAALYEAATIILLRG